jgi:hypothetical protein
LAPLFPGLKPYRKPLEDAKGRIDRACPELKGVGSSEPTMNFITEFAQEAWETPGDVLLNKLAEGIQKRVDAIRLQTNGIQNIE